MRFYRAILVALTLALTLILPARPQLAGTTITNGAGVPTGGCISGSTYINSSNGSSWTCVNSVWLQSLSANSSGVLANVKLAVAATWATNSNTITTGASDPPFVAGDVGKIIFGTTNCDALNGNIDCNTVAIPQGTINSITNSHVAIISSTTIAANQSPTAAGEFGPGGFTGWVVWGSDDTTALQTAWTATKTSPGQVLILPEGMSFVSGTPFCGTSGTSVGNSITGSGPSFGGTVLIPLPNFFGPCTGGLIYSDPALGQLYTGDQTFVANSTLRNFMVWGVGQSGVGVNTTNPAINLTNMYAENVWVVGWNWHMNNTTNTAPGMTLNGAVLVNSGVWSAGNFGISVAANGPVTQYPNTITGGLGYSTVGAGMIVSGTNGTRLTTTGLQTGGGVAGADYGVRMQNGFWSSNGDWFGGANFTGGIATLQGDYDTFLGNFGVTVAGGSVRAQGTAIDAFIMSSGSFYDLGGNYITTTGAPFTTSPPFPITITGGTLLLNTSGVGAPAANLCVAGAGGSTYKRTDGTPTTTLYICDGSTHTWTAK
jgi:hypothetical protein